MNLAGQSVFEWPVLYASNYPAVGILLRLVAWSAHGTLPLRKLAELAGGMDYTAAGAAVSRFQRGLSTDPKLSRLVNKIHVELSNVEI